MVVLFEQYWWLFVIALLIGIAIAWRIFGGGSKTRVESSLSADVLDEGAAPARRNQAFIDAAPAAAQAYSPAPTPATAPVAQPAAPPPPPAEAVEDPAPQAAEPAVAVEPAPASPVPSSPAPSSDDDLTRIKGLGPKLAALLQSLGITRFEQIAAWSDADVDRIDAQLGNFQGRIRRDNWIEQARFLATGDTAGFEGRFGKV